MGDGTNIIELILRKLEQLEAGQNEMRSEIVAIKVALAKSSDYTDEIKELRGQVESLRLFKAKMIGIAVAINAVAVFAGWLIQTVISARH